MDELIRLFMELSSEQQEDVISWVKQRLPEGSPCERKEGNYMYTDMSKEGSTNATHMELGSMRKKK